MCIHVVLPSDSLNNVFYAVVANELSGNEVNVADHLVFFFHYGSNKQQRILGRSGSMGQARRLSVVASNGQR